MDVPTIDFYNEKGNVRAKVRNQLHTEIEDKVYDVFQDDYHIQPNVNGGFSILLGRSKEGYDIYAHIMIKVNDKSPRVDEYTGKVKPEKAPIVLPRLFD